MGDLIVPRQPGDLDQFNLQIEKEIELLKARTRLINSMPQIQPFVADIAALIKHLVTSSSALQQIKIQTEDQRDRRARAAALIKDYLELVKENNKDLKELILKSENDYKESLINQLNESNAGIREIVRNLLNLM